MRPLQRKKATHFPGNLSLGNCGRVERQQLLLLLLLPILHPQRRRCLGVRTPLRHCTMAGGASSHHVGIYQGAVSWRDLEMRLTALQTGAVQLVGIVSS